MNAAKPFNIGQILERVQEELEGLGISVQLGADAKCCEQDGSSGVGVKVFCVTPGVKSSVEEMGQSPRDQVIMVRVDKDTCDTLDAWVATGAVKSRSEAAALFIREGLKVRADELDRLRGALDDLEAAQERLRKQAQEVFGSEPEEDG